VTLYESAIDSRFVISRKISRPATFDFCNSIGHKQTSPLLTIEFVEHSTPITSVSVPSQVSKSSRNSALKSKWCEPTSAGESGPGAINASQMKRTINKPAQYPKRVLFPLNLQAICMFAAEEGTKVELLPWTNRSPGFGKDTGRYTIRQNSG
jgi:hypothetical protein